MATELGVAYVSIVASMSGFAKSLAPAFKDMEKDAGKSGESSGKGFGGGFAAAGVVAGAAAGLAIGAAVAGAVSSAMDIGAANDKLAAQLGLNEKESAAAGKVAGSLYAGAYGESIGEVNDAVGAVMSSIKGMRTASSADVEAMTAKVLDLSSAFELDAGRAAQVAGQLITSGLAVDGVAAADLLTASLQKVPAAVREDLLDAADEYAPFFEDLGFSGEKAMGLLVTASADGMYGIDKTGDALKEFGIRATDLSKTSSDAYSTIGLDQLEMSNAILAGGDTAAVAFEKIVAGIQGVEDPAGRAEAAIALFGTPLEDLSVSEIPKFLDGLVSAETGLGDVGGAAEAMGKTLNDNASTNLESFKRQISTTFVDFIGGKALPAVEKLAGYLSANFGPILDDVKGKLQTFGQWFSDNIETIKTVATVIGIILIPMFVRLGVLALISGAQQVLAWTMASGGAIKAAAIYVAQGYIIAGRWAFMATAAVLSGIKTAAVWTGSIIKQAVLGAASFAVSVARVVGGWVLMGVQSLIHAARMAAAWLIAMGPIGWIIIAVVALVALVIANWDKISAFTAKVWTAIVGWVTQAWVNIKKSISDAILWVVNWINVKMTQIRVGWEIVWSTIKNFFVTVWEGIKAAVRLAVEWVSTKIRDVLEGIKTTWSNAWTWVKTTVSNVWDGIKTVISDAWNGVKTTITKLIDFVKKDLPKAFESAKDGIATAWNKIQEVAKVPIRFVVDKVINDGLLGVFNKIPGVNIPRLNLPKGFAHGGYTGDGAKYAPAGLVHKGEYVFTKEQTAALGKDKLAAMAHSAVRGQAAGVSPTGAMPTLNTGFPGVIAHVGKNRAFVEDNAPGWHVPQAVEVINQMSALKLQMARTGMPRIQTGLGFRQAMNPNVIAYASGNEVRYGSAFANSAPQFKRAVSIHELMHVLGQSHTNAASIMQPTIGAHMMPTRYDVNSMERLYGKADGSSGTLTDSGFEKVNPFDGLIDALMKKIKEAFPSSGMFVDAAGGLAKSGIEQVVKMVSDIKNGISKIAGDVFGNIKDFFGGSAATAPTLYDNGGVLSPNGGRPQLVQNKSGKPEYIFTNREMQALTERGGSGRQIVIQGNVGWDPAEVARQIDTRERRQRVIEGVLV